MQLDAYRCGRDAADLGSDRRRHRPPGTDGTPHLRATRNRHCHPGERADRRISQRCRWVIGHGEQPLGESVPRRPFGASTSYGWAVPIQDVAARDIAAGDVVRLDDPQAQRVERAVHVDGRVVLELRPVGLEVSETSCVTLPDDRIVSRLGTAAE
jgi:hypothetical protein